MGVVRNLGDLLDPSKSCTKCIKARETALKLVDVGIESANPYSAVARYISVRSDGRVDIGGKVYDVRRVFVVGFGKAAYSMARAVEDKLSDMIDSGVISVPHTIADRCKLRRIKVIGSGHPLPNENSIRAACEILDLVSEAREGDLVIVLISGGGSALFEKPVDNVSLNDMIETTKLLLKCGATINEINTVRKHLSLVKGGKLAKYAYPARVVSLIISDVVGDDLSTIASGPTAPDNTTFHDAYNVLVKYGIWDKLPESVREYISRGLKGLEEETVKPGDPVFTKVRNIIVASNIDSLVKMRFEAEKMGYNAVIVTSMIQGEAREVGKVIASIALEVKRSNMPIPKPAVLLFGGETTVTVRGSGVGGRNQELALSASTLITGEHGVAVVSVGSDGIDGVTDVAGGIVDAHSLERAEKAGLKVDEILGNNDSYRFFKTLGDYVYTGPTGTNVNDLIVVVVEK